MHDAVCRPRESWPEYPLGPHPSWRRCWRHNLWALPPHDNLGVTGRSRIALAVSCTRPITTGACARIVSQRTSKAPSLLTILDNSLPLKPNAAASIKNWITRRQQSCLNPRNTQYSRQSTILPVGSNDVYVFSINSTKTFVLQRIRFAMYYLTLFFLQNLLCDSTQNIDFFRFKLGTRKQALESRHQFFWIVRIEKFDCHQRLL
jgi:hypothetical protein